MKLSLKDNLFSIMESIPQESYVSYLCGETYTYVHIKCSIKNAYRMVKEMKYSRFTIGKDTFRIIVHDGSYINENLPKEHGIYWEYKNRYITDASMRKIIESRTIL